MARTPAWLFAGSGHVGFVSKALPAKAKRLTTSGREPVWAARQAGRRPALVTISFLARSSPFPNRHLRPACLTKAKQSGGGGRSEVGLVAVQESHSKAGWAKEGGGWERPPRLEDSPLRSGPSDPPPANSEKGCNGSFLIEGVARLLLPLLGTGWVPLGLGPGEVPDQSERSASCTEAEFLQDLLLLSKAATILKAGVILTVQSEPI